MTARRNREKQLVAEAAANVVEGGMLVGIGTGTTIGQLLPLLPGRDVVYIATSPATEKAALKLGLSVRPFSAPNHLNLALDGADQVGPTGWLVKGAGRAHTREKVVAAAAERFVVLVSSDKLATKLTPPFASWQSSVDRASTPALFRQGERTTCEAQPGQAAGQPDRRAG